MPGVVGKVDNEGASRLNGLCCPKCILVGVQIMIGKLMRTLEPSDS